MNANGHDQTMTAAAVQQLAAQKKQEAEMVAYQNRAMPHALNAVTQQRNAALDQLSLAHAELVMARSDLQTEKQRNAELQTLADELRADLTRLGEQLAETKEAIVAGADLPGPVDTPPQQ